ncbi:MAG: hypothetical protein ABSG68_01840 [Thermoguttaceae bacterium]|jgi:hypothetical protein
MAVAERRVESPGYSPLSPPLPAALRLLMRAETFARDAECPIWDFAVEIHCLIALGLTTSDLRFLVRSGYVEHAVEISRPTDASRRFRPWDNLCFQRQTCFVLTAAGAQLVSSEEDPGPDLLPIVSLSLGSAGGTAAERSAVPSWDGDRKVLHVDGQLVKQFKVPSPNQEAILTAFEEEGWPSAIDDPLPPQPDQEEKRRLRATIQSLNAHHKKRLLHFRGDGSGERVLWELVDRRARRCEFHGQRQLRAA